MSAEFEADEKPPMTSHRIATALIMAAARGPNDPMARAFGARHKCLIEVAGTAMIVRVVQALKGVREIGTICVSIDRTDALEGITGLEDLVIFKSQDSAPASVVSAIGQLQSPFPLLVTTADHALLSPEIVEDFCLKARNAHCDIAIGLAGRADIERVDRTAKRTYFKFNDGEFSGCNLFYLKSEKALNAVRFWHWTDKIRKNPIALARTFGFTIMVRYLLGILSLKNGLDYASKLLDVDVHAAILTFGEAAIDVDKPEDHELVTKLLQQRS